jgi:hypothetical protein
MQLWESIINTAMTGTDKGQVNTHDLPGELAETAAPVVENKTLDKEDRFLQIASLAFNFRQTGVLPLNKTEVTIPPAKPQEKEYCSKEALQVLKDILSQESIPLLKLWLNECDRKGQIVHPELIPVLFEQGVHKKSLQPLISVCCGKRGEWLGSFNKDWQFSSIQTSEELWQTGTMEQRKTVLREIRNNDPAQAREWLRQTWPQEDANTKAIFLEQLQPHIGEEDIPFLESLTSEKGKKVKEEALKLLKLIPGSPVVQQYKEALRLSVILKKEKMLFGIMSKTGLLFQLPASINEAIFKTGIEKLSSNSKEFSDDEFIIYQLVQSVPPSFWEDHFNLEPGAVIDLFQKDVTGKKMIPALVVAIGKFNDKKWALQFIQHSAVFYIDLIPFLEPGQKEPVMNKYFDRFTGSIIAHATKMEHEWSQELAGKIFTYAAKNPYEYNVRFFNQFIHLVPSVTPGELEKCAPAAAYFRNMWKNTCEEIIKLTHLKTRVQKAFNV